MADSTTMIGVYLRNRKDGEKKEIKSEDEKIVELPAKTDCVILSIDIVYLQLTYYKKDDAKVLNTLDNDGRFDPKYLSNVLDFLKDDGFKVDRNNQNGVPEGHEDIKKVLVHYFPN